MQIILFQSNNLPNYNLFIKFKSTTITTFFSVILLQVLIPYQILIFKI